MEMENQQQEKIQKLKVRSVTDLEQLKEQLQNQFSQAEFKLSIKFCLQANSFLNLIFSSFNEFCELRSLSIKLSNLIEFDIIEFFGNLKLFQNLESLSITLLQATIKQFEREFTIGESIENLVNLKNLSLIIDCNAFSQQLNFLKLKRAYRKLVNLRSLQLELVNLSKSSYLITIIKGLKYLVNLDQLAIKNMYFASIKDDGLRILSKQIRSLINLKSLQILDNSQRIDKFQYFTYFGQSFMYLQNLQNLVLQFSVGQNTKYCLINDLQQLRFLKNLEILIKIESFDAFQQYLDVISKISINIESMILKFNIALKVDSQILIKISSFLMEIQKIKELHLSFFQLEVPLKDILDLLKNLQNLKDLQKLSIDYDNIEQKTMDNLQLNLDLIQEFKNSLSNLSIFEINFQQNELPNFWIPIIKNNYTLNHIKIITKDILKKEKRATDLKSLIVNKQNLEILTLILNKSYQINQSNLILFFNQLSLHSNLKEIQLDFSQNQSCDDLLLESMEKSFKSLINLTKLEINLRLENNFSLKGVSLLNQGLNYLKNLELLNINLESATIPVQEMRVLFESIKNMTKLKKLSLNYRISIEGEEIGTNQVIELPMSLKDISIKIQEIDLNYNQISGLIQGLEPLRNLRALYLQFNVNELNEVDLDEIQRVLSNLKNLQKLSLLMNQIKLLNLIRLFKNLQFLEEIELMKINQFKINFSFQKVIRKENERIENELPNESINSSFQGIQLYFNSNQWLEIQSIYFMEEFFKMQQLLGLILVINKNNKIKYLLGNYFFSSLKNLKTLQTLELSILQNSDIGNNILNSLGQAFKEFTNLITFSLTISFENNDIKISQIKEFTGNLQCLINLRDFKIKLSQSNLEDFKIVLESLEYNINLKYLHLEVEEPIPINKNFFYLFEKDHFQNLSRIDLLIKFQQEKNDYQNMFYDSLRNLQSLRVLKSDQISIEQYSKIIRLVNLIK